MKHGHFKIIFTTIVMCIFISITVYANSTTMNILIDDEQVLFYAVKQNERIYVPIGYFSRYLGKSVSWDGEHMQSTISSPKLHIVLTMNSNEIIIDRNYIHIIGLEFSGDMQDIIYPKIINNIAHMPVYVIWNIFEYYAKVEDGTLIINTPKSYGDFINYLNLVSIYVDDILDTRYLELINHNYAIQHLPPTDNLRLAWPTLPVSHIEGLYLHQTALYATAKLIAAAREYGITSLFVSSGFRNLEHQQRLFENGNPNYVMPPSHSEHHTGLAVDILATGIAMQHLGDFAEGIWLAQNSYKFGFILRFPQNRQYITGISFEPWHFRYIGRPHAYFINNNNLVLEEYLHLLRKHGSLQINFNDEIYYILHQIPENGMIYIPYGFIFSISSDNLGGYIVTAHR